ncbi:MAG: 2OG-Fe(II) oxygenase [Pseudanabaena sp.]|jgi:Rps23 Pro-64 3,4-dihydroxylase Tpa1-like proline 4-hydroxylase
MSIQTEYLKSRIISEEDKCQVTRLIQQLDYIEHIAKSGFWMSTEDLGLLLNLEQSFIYGLNLEVESKRANYSFFWRNFECILVERQLEIGFWLIKHRQDISQNLDIHTVPRSQPILSINEPKPSRINDSILLDNSPKAEIVPSPYALIDNFLPESQVTELLRYSINKQPEFEPTTNSASDPNYRRSFFLPYFPEFSESIIKMIWKITPQIITHLGINNFAIDQIESQMTAHNHGNYYKLHNDSGSPDSAKRVLTYVYYYHREPKPFTGGELIIYDSKIENGYAVAASSFKAIEPTNNTIIFFPSYCMHEVLPVNCPSEYFSDSRFTINGWVRQI